MIISVETGVKGVPAPEETLFRASVEVRPTASSYQARASLRTRLQDTDRIIRDLDALDQVAHGAGVAPEAVAAIKHARAAAHRARVIITAQLTTAERPRGLQ